MGTTIIYAGSFDPPTLGHEDLALRALRFCDNLIIAIGRNSAKKNLFTVEERIEMLQHLFKPYGDRVQVEAFQGMLVTYARARNVSLILRGLRTATDFESELLIAGVNAEQSGENHGLPNIDTIFLPTSPRLGLISSSFARELASHGANLEHYVHPYVEQKLLTKFKNQ
jgi:pantetheine-phosphate adenylyltransferase